MELRGQDKSEQRKENDRSRSQTQENQHIAGEENQRNGTKI